MNIRFKKKDLRLNEDAFTDVSNNARQNPSGRANAPLGDFTDSNNDGQTKITVNPQSNDYHKSRENHRVRCVVKKSMAFTPYEFFTPPTGGKGFSQTT